MVRQRHKMLHSCDYVIFEDGDWIIMGCEDNDQGWTSGVVHAIDHKNGELLGCYILAPHVISNSKCHDCDESIPESVRQLWYLDNFEMIKTVK